MQIYFIAQINTWVAIVSLHLEISASFSSLPLFVMNSTTAWIAPSADCLILSHIATEQTCRAETSFTKNGDEMRLENLSKVFNYLKTSKDAHRELEYLNTYLILSE